MSELAPAVPVQGALCFVEADLPVLRKLNFNGFPLLYPKPLAKQLNSPGPLTPARVRQLAAALATRFPSA
jgi:hypothetical protein